MNRPVLIDTSGFFALLDIRDAAHDGAERLIADFRTARRKAVTTDHILGETYTLLKARGLGHLCNLFRGIAHSAEDMEVEWTDSSRFLQAERFLLSHADKGYSFTDCLSFVVMREKKLTEALTTDGHFTQAGFKALLAPA